MSAGGKVILASLETKQLGQGLSQECAQTGDNRFEVAGVLLRSVSQMFTQEFRFYWLWKTLLVKEGRAKRASETSFLILVLPR